MGNMTHFVDHEQIEKGISKIQTFMIDNDTTSSKISTELDNLKNAISINSKSPANKGEDVAKAMRNLKNTNNTTIDVLKHVIEIYFQAKANSVSYIRSEVGKVNGIK